jgi:hypothetical protein
MGITNAEFTDSLYVHIIFFAGLGKETKKQ